MKERRKKGKTSAILQILRGIENATRSSRSHCNSVHADNRRRKSVKLLLKKQNVNTYGTSKRSGVSLSWVTRKNDAKRDKVYCRHLRSK